MLSHPHGRPVGCALKTRVFLRFAVHRTSPLYRPFGLLRALARLFRSPGLPISPLATKPSTPHLLEAVGDASADPPLRAGETDTGELSSIHFSRMARLLSGAVQDPDCLAVLAKLACEALGGSGALVVTLHGAQARVDAACGQVGALRGTTFPAVDSLASRAIRDRQTMIIDDARTHPDCDPRFIDRFSFRAVAVAPLEVEGQMVGALLVVHTRAGAFTDDDGGRLRRLADLGALAIHHGRVHQRERRSTREALALGEIAQQLNQSLDLDLVAQTVVERAAELLGARDARVALVEGEHLRVLATTGGVAVNHAERVPIDSTFSGEAVRSGRPLRTTDFRASSERWPRTVAALTSGRPNAIAVPLISDSVSLGVILVHGNDDRDFDDHDERLLVALASHASVAVANARLYASQSVERDLAVAAADITRIALGALALPCGAREITDVIEGIVPASGLALGLVAESGNDVTWIEARGTLVGIHGVRFPLANSIARQVVALGETIALEARALDGAHERFCAPVGTILVPLIARHRVFGVVAATPSLGAELPSGSVTCLTRLAAPIALAIDVLLMSEEERTRRERERVLAAALATMDQPVFILTLERRIRYANAASAREYGYTADELLGMPIDLVVASSVPARRLGSADEGTPSGVWRAEHVHRRRDGSHFPASVMLNYILDDAGAPAGQVLSVRNLSDERRLAEQLRQSEKLAALGELVAGVAHELNNPLAGISAFAQLLLEETLLPDQRESVRLIKRESDRAVGVIRDLLIFSRKSGPSRAPVDLNQIIELTLRLRGYSMRSAGVDVVVDLAPGIPPVWGDDQRLQQVLLNLVVNAEYAMQRSATKRLMITSSLCDTGVTIRISDSGVGMTAETCQRIFEPFYTTKPAGDGTGLGLSVSYGIIRAHGGTIRVESVPDRGTAFHIFLPASSGSMATAS